MPFGWHGLLPMLLPHTPPLLLPSSFSTMIMGGEGQGEKSDRIYAMLQDFKARGVPVDGVGLQMHISLNVLLPSHSH